MKAPVNLIYHPEYKDYVADVPQLPVARARTGR